MVCEPPQWHDSRCAEGCTSVRVPNLHPVARAAACKLTVLLGDPLCFCSSIGFFGPKEELEGKTARAWVLLCVLVLILASWCGNRGHTGLTLKTKVRASGYLSKLPTFMLLCLSLCADRVRREPVHLHTCGAAAGEIPVRKPAGAHVVPGHHLRHLCLERSWLLHRGRCRVAIECRVRVCWLCVLGMACSHAVVVSVTTTALLLLLLLSVLQVFSVRYRQQIEAAIQEHERRSRAGSDASASSEGAASGTTEHEGDTSVKQAAEALADHVAEELHLAQQLAGTDEGNEPSPAQLRRRVVATGTVEE